MDDSQFLKITKRLQDLDTGMVKFETQSAYADYVLKITIAQALADIAASLDEIKEHMKARELML